MKRGFNFKMSNPLFSVSFAVLCSRIGSQLTSKRSLPQGETSGFFFGFVVVVVVVAAAAEKQF